MSERSVVIHLKLVVVNQVPTNTGPVERLTRSKISLVASGRREILRCLSVAHLVSFRSIAFPVRRNALFCHYCATLAKTYLVLGMGLSKVVEQLAWSRAL